MNVDSTAGSRLLLVSTYPPTRCGIASFARSLVDALEQIQGKRPAPGVVRLVPGWDTWMPSVPDVIAEPNVDTMDWPKDIGVWCRGYDMLWIQHEFGIFGPDDGVNVLELSRASPLPIAVTLHTVPDAPTDRQRMILERLSVAAEAVVVMSQLAFRRLIAVYDIDFRKVHVIPHGAQPSPVRLRSSGTSHRPTIVNWGLIGPGKGLEWGIKAMAFLRNLEPSPRLLIHGTTHPNVKRREGEMYRAQLFDLVHALGLEDSVRIQDGYMTGNQLTSLIQDADLALLPYDTTDQVTSGVLVDAVGAGLPVVATAFPHAQEVLSSGAGRIVPHRSPEAIARAIEGLLTNPSALKTAEEEARRVGRQFAWPRVALQYERLVRMILARDNEHVA